MGAKKQKKKKLKSVCGNPTVFAPKKVFDAWDDSTTVPDPKGFLGIVRAGKTDVVAFHDPESCYAMRTKDGVLLFQVIYSSGDVSKHLAKLPEKGWKKTKGTYASAGGEHVLFDSILFHEDAGKPVYVELAKGDYVLEELGMWQPNDETEMVLARLVRA